MIDNPAIDILLDSARRAAQRGEMARARAVVRTLTLQYPDSLKAWQVLADLAEHDQERQQALEQIAVLLPAPILPAEVAPEPDRAVTQPTIAWDASPETYPTPVALTHTQALEAQAQRMRWPIYLVIGIAAILIVGLLVWRTTSNDLLGSITSSDPPVNPSITIATLIPTEPAAGSGAPTTELLPTQPALPTALATSTPLPTAGPTATPRPVLPIGTVVQQGSWTIALLRPDDMLVLDGSIGDLQPQGRFALALLAIANDSDTAVKLPVDLVTLVDAAGKRYQPSLPASDAYLNTYGRGQVGDLSLREAIPPGAGNVSIPLIFDVPADARDLYLVISGDSKGWRMSGR
jgi:hypothetical protein